VRTFLAGETVFKEGLETGQLLILKTGAVAVFKDSVAIARVDEPGAVLGEISALQWTNYRNKFATRWHPSCASDRVEPDPPKWLNDGSLWSLDRLRRGTSRITVQMPEHRSFGYRAQNLSSQEIAPGLASTLADRCIAAAGNVRQCDVGRCEHRHRPRDSSQGPACTNCATHQIVPLGPVREKVNRIWFDRRGPNDHLVYRRVGYAVGTVAVINLLLGFVAEARPAAERPRPQAAGGSVERDGFPPPHQSRSSSRARGSSRRLGRASVVTLTLVSPGRPFRVFGPRTWSR
jgi:hypothetical protein